MNYFTEEQVIELAEQSKLWCSESNTVFSEETRNHLLGRYKELMNLAVSTAIGEPKAWGDPTFSYLNKATKDTVFGSHTIPLYTVKEIS